MTPDHDRLLADLLSDSAPPGFREALLRETLRLSRRRRRFRRTRRAAAFVAAVGLLGLSVRHFLRGWHSLPTEARTPDYEIVHTRPLPAGAIIRTQPLGAEHMVASFANIGRVHTMRGRGLFRIINDNELLALAAPRSAALVRTGPNSQELIFLDLADESEP